jgi:amino acid transporter
MAYSHIKRFFLGSPIASQRERHERLSIPIALAVFASDALSSTAYATEEILLALSVSAYAVYANLLSLPVALAIAALIAIVVISYRQVIRAYPDGGGSYEVSKQCLGPLASQISGASLLIDYVLTVAVSVSASVAALTSTKLLPHEQSVNIALLFILIMTLLNLRGLRESGRVIAVPAYTFIVAMVGMMLFGFWQLATGHVPSSVPVTAPLNPLQETSAASANIVLNVALLTSLFKAFSHGCSALTGIEAISNGVKAFKEPVAFNANRTMVLMGIILGAVFLGMTYLSYGFHIVPMHTETVLSQVARAVFGEGSFGYYLIQGSTMLVLALAANTSFAGFPRLAGLLARDGFLPRQLMSLGDRLVFSNGIMLLGTVSAFLVVLFNADTHGLLPLYAVGVFLSFTFAQAGMVIHHLRRKEPGWKWGLRINAFGAVTTGLVTLLLGIDKFMEGAWLIWVTIPALILVFRSISNHYQSIQNQLMLPKNGYCPLPIEHSVLVLVSNLHKGTIPALEYAKTISDRVEAVHVELNPQATEQLRQNWDEWGCGIPLTILKSPYRSITEPLVKYIGEVEDRYEHDLVTIIIPEFVTKRFWHNFLHNQTSLLIKTLLRLRKGKVVTTIRYYLDA